MRPLELTIKGFGPYLSISLSEKDFKLLNDSKLFLIYGEIGAGKTTLFDAITFALYGESSFPDRKIKDLISHHIKDFKNFWPEVTFTFLLGKDRIKVKRVLNPEGRSDARLWLNGVIRSAKVTEVNTYLRELLRLSHKQFKQIILLPQGGYRDILLASREDREALFEKLFQLEEYSQLVEFLKGKTKACKSDLETLNSERQGLLKSVACTSTQEVKDLIKQKEGLHESLEREALALSSKLKEKEKKVEKLQDLIKLLKELEEVNTELAKLEEKKEKIQALEEKIKKLEHFKEISPIYEELKRRWKTLRDLSSSKKDLQIEFEEKKSSFANLEKERAKILEKKQEIEIKKEKKTTLENLLKNLQELEKIKKEKERIEEEEKKTEDQLTSLEEEKKRLEELELALKLTQELNSLKEKALAFNKFKEIKQTLEILQREREILKDRLKKLREEEKVLQEKNFLGILAERLTEGHPCPLCGSTSHPSKAKVPLDFALRSKEISEEIQHTERKLEKLAEQERALEAERGSFAERIKGEREEDLAERILKTETKLKELNLKKVPEEQRRWDEERLAQLKKEREEKIKALLEKKQTLLVELGELEGRQKTLKEGLLSLTGEDLSVEEVQGELLSLGKEIKEYEEELERINQRYDELKTELSKLETKIKEKEESLPKELSYYCEILSKVFVWKKRGLFRRKEELKQNLAEIKELEKFKRELEEYYQKYTALKERKKIAEIKIKTGYPQFSEKKLEEWERDLTLAQEELKELKERYLKKVGEKERLKEQIEILSGNLRHLVDLEEKIQQKERGYQELEFLAKLLAGENPKRVSLKSFITSLFLERVFRRANFYLKEFSFNRYQFVINEVLQKSFEISILDAYTGRHREARTLSGGESFIAILALALGISDFLQRITATKPIKSFFIDEGFGNLDSQTLDRVVEILVKVSNETDRVIGVISHLSELKDRYPAQLEVIKEKEGSKIKVKKVY